MHRFRRYDLAVILSALALVAAACGGSDEPAATDGVTETTQAEPADTSVDSATEGPTGEVVRVMASERYDVGMIGSDAAEALGIYEEIGVVVENLGGQEVAQVLATGEVDVGMASPNRFIGAVLAGLDAKIVGPTEEIWSQYIIVNSDLGVTSVDGLEPGRIGITGFGSAGHFSGVSLAEELGWSEDEYEIVELGDSAGVMAALRQGQIDLFMWSGSLAFALEEEGEAVILGNVGEFLGANPLNVIVASSEMIEERPEDLRAFCEGFYEGQRRFRDDPDLAVETFVDVWGVGEELTERIVSDGVKTLAVDDEISDEMLENMARATKFTVEGIPEDLDGSDIAEMYVPCSSV